MDVFLAVLGVTIMLIGSVIVFTSMEHEYFGVGAIMMVVGLLISIVVTFIHDTNLPDYQSTCFINGETVYMETSSQLPDFTKYDKCTIKTLY